MSIQMRRALFAALATVSAFASLVWALGLPLNQNKKQLGLDYEITAVADKNDTVLVTLTVADLGKLKPLESIVLSVPSRQVKNGFDMLVPMATKRDGSKLKAWAQLSRDVAERATIELVPQNPPKGEEIIGWVFHPIPVKEHIKERE